MSSTAQIQSGIIQYYENKSEQYDTTRHNEEIRPTTQLDNKLTRADGSVELRQGNTIVLCAINGPTRGDKPKQLEDRAYVELSLKLVPVPPSTDQHKLILQLYNQETYDIFLKRHLTQLAEHILDLKAFPRQKIAVSFEIISNDGSLLSICSNAFMKCAINSGIVAKCSGLSYTVAKINFNDEIIYRFDPSLQDEVTCTGLMTMTLENLQYLHNISTGQSVEKRRFLIQKLKHLQEALRANVATLDEKQKDPSSNSMEDSKVVDLSSFKLDDIQRQIKQATHELQGLSDEPRIIQFNTIKEWNGEEIEHCMMLIIRKWLLDEQNLH